MTSVPVDSKATLSGSRIPSISFSDLTYQAMNALASLRLTVTLFALGAFLVFAGTLAQVEMGIWDVMRDYFRSYVVWIPLRVFFPPNWFPHLTFISGGFYFPGGWLIGAGLLVNITAAHLVRFKVRAVGSKLWFGLFLTLIGIALTTMIILYGNWKDGVQDKPIETILGMEWNFAIYSGIVGSLGVLSLISLVGIFTMERSKIIERILLVVSIVVMVGGLVWLLRISPADLDTSVMRILWNLIQGTVASVVMLVGCSLVFGKRGGIVLLHGGIALMMVNELWVGTKAVEEQITLKEGAETNIAQDIRSVEISVTRRDQKDFDEVVAIPRDVLTKHVATQKPIESEHLPFDIRVDQFFRNSTVTKISPGESHSYSFSNGEVRELRVTHGGARNHKVIPLRPVSGLESEKINLASAYVTLLKKDSDEELATLLLTQLFNQSNFTLPDDGSQAENFKYEGVEYELGLRFARSVKPYELKLLDVGKEDYAGTTTPRSFWSKFEITTPDGKTESQYISMNEPLRFLGETFYQSGYNEVDNVEVSTLQVVKNSGWMIPYVSCMIVAVGMLAQFSFALFGFLTKVNRENIGIEPGTNIPVQPTGAASARAAGIQGIAKGLEKSEKGSADDFDTVPPLEKGFFKSSEFIVPLLIGLLIAGWLGSKWMRSWSSIYDANENYVASEDEFDFALAGQMPIINSGRSLPIDSYARNTLKFLYQREEIEYKRADKEAEKIAAMKKKTYKVEKDGYFDLEKHSAVNWLFDVITRREGVDDLQLFRIYNKRIQNALELSQKRHRYRYSFNELNRASAAFAELESEVSKKNENGIDSITVTDSGKGFTTPPAVTITSKSGSGAVGRAVLDSDGGVKEVKIVERGSGYIDATVLFIPSADDSATGEVVSPVATIEFEDLAAKNTFERDVQTLSRQFGIYRQLRATAMDFAAFKKDREIAEAIKKETDPNWTPAPDTEEDQLLTFASIAIDQIKGVDSRNNPLPLLVPSMISADVSDDDDAKTAVKRSKDWETLSVVMARQAVKDFAKNKKLDSPDKFGDYVWEQLVGSEEELVERAVQRQVLNEIRTVVMGMRPDLEGEKLNQMVVQIYQQQELRAPIESRVLKQELDQITASIAAQKAQVKSGFVDLVASKEFASETPAATKKWMDMLDSYSDEDEKEFNESVAGYLGFVKTLNDPVPNELNWNKSNREFAYNGFSAFYWCTGLYIIAFAVSAIGWLGFWRNGFKHTAFAIICAAFIFHSIGLMDRILISGRPPVTNLYSSAVFIAWGGVLIGMMVHLIFRLGVGNIKAAYFGATGLLIAYNLGLGEDTFKVLVAVLDTQFWLSTHVVCITFGYVVTFVAGAFGVKYLIIRGWFNLFRPDDTETLKYFSKVLARLIYGSVCFALLFSFVGTVLGGLWADDSWGRFWGWDPKENGALIIVIWNALILHARWGGMVREKGIAVLAVFGNVVTIWSWFGVNQLGVGLHSYGFNEGILRLLFVSAATFLVIMLLALIPTRNRFAGQN